MPRTMRIKDGDCLEMTSRGIRHAKAKADALYDQSFLDHLVATKRSVGDIREGEFLGLYHMARRRANRCRSIEHAATYGSIEYQMMLLGAEIAGRMIREHSYPEKK